MRVLVCAGYYAPHIGGYEKNVHELVERLVDKGHNVTILTCNTELAEGWELNGNIFIQRLPSWNLLSRTFPFPKPSLDLFRLFSHVGTKAYDVVVTQTRFFPTSFVGLLFAKRYHIPLIHVERGTCHAVLSNKILGLVGQIYDHTMGSAIVKTAKVNVGVAQSACEFVKHLGGKRIRVIYNGIDACVNRSQTVDGITRVVYVGRLIYAKGVQNLIRAFELCCKTHVEMRLWIIGDGNYRTTLEAQAGASKYGSRITFCGELKHDAVMEMLSLSDIFVNPSYSEGLPTSVMEAASVGVPIIATDVGGTREVISDGTGLLVQPHDVKGMAERIQLLSFDGEMARRMGIKAKQAVRQKFNWDEIADQWDKLLKEVAI